MARREYKRIGGRGARRRQMFTWNTLWLGADHLLQVENTGYTEEYKRFYFRDIQSITIQKDNRFLYWSLFFAAVLAVCLFFVGTVEEPAGKYFFGSFGALFLLLLIINLVKGPSCYTRIKTAVQEEQVPAFRRVRNTQKALAQIRELIAAAQGTMSADEMRGRLGGGQIAQPVSPVAPAPVLGAAPANFAPPPPPATPPPAVS